MVFPQNDHLYKGHHIFLVISTKKIKDKVSHLQDNIQGVIYLGDWCSQGDVDSLSRGTEHFLCVMPLCELMTGIGDSCFLAYLQMADPKTRVPEWPGSALKADKSKSREPFKNPIHCSAGPLALHLLHLNQPRVDI